MNAIKSDSKQIFIDVFMILVSTYFSFDYYYLIMSGDDLLRRKIVLVIWILAVIGWTIKLIYDLKQKKA
jgi:predicted membrane channel-forming protein YqfA (hemolysin III family)